MQCVNGNEQMLKVIRDNCKNRNLYSVPIDAKYCLSHVQESLDRYREVLYMFRFSTTKFDFEVIKKICELFFLTNDFFNLLL